MSEDVPLTAFDGDDGDAEDDAGGAESEEPVEESTETEEAAAAEQPETPALTYTSSPDGATCAACGETVEKRWRAGEGGVAPDESGVGGVDDPDALVCPDCKEW